MFVLRPHHFHVTFELFNRCSGTVVLLCFSDFSLHIFVVVAVVLFVLVDREAGNDN